MGGKDKMKIEINQIYEKLGINCPYSIPDFLDYYVFPSVPVCINYNGCILQEKEDEDTGELIYPICKQEEHALCPYYIKQKNLEGEVKNGS